MDNVFLSKRNIMRQLDVLLSRVQVKNKEAQIKLRLFLVSQMKSVYKKYKDRRPSHIDVKKFIEMMNKKSIDECLKVIYSSKQQRSQHIYDVAQKRDKDLHGTRKPILNRRPTDPRIEQRSNANMQTDTKLDGLANSEKSCYAPIQQIPMNAASDTYISTTGEYGDKMVFGNVTENFDKRKTKDELESRMMQHSRYFVDKPNGPDMSNSMGMG